MEQYVRSGQHEARRTLAGAIERGYINRPPFCERCEGECVPHGHHDDYRKPLEVLWLCSRCHAIVHPHHPGSRRAALGDRAAQTQRWDQATSTLRESRQSAREPQEPTA